MLYQNPLKTFVC